MLNFLLDSVFIQVGGKVLQCVGIPKGTNCVPLLAELLLREYESNAMIRFSRTKFVLENLIMALWPSNQSCELH